MNYFRSGAPHDDFKGRGVGSLTGDPMSRRGKTRPIYTLLDTPDEKEELDDSSDLELDDYVDTLLSPEAESVVHSKIDHYMGGTDSYAPRGSRQYYGIYEFAGHHRNPIRRGISPYPQPKHSGPPIGGGGSGQAFRTTGNFRGIGTQYGSSRPHKIMSDLEDDTIFNLEDMLDPMERSFRRHNNRVKRVLNLLKENLL